MNDVEKFDELLRTVGITSREGLVSRFAQTLQDGNISNHWNILGNGCFKVVVELNDDYVLKFVSNSNNTQGELCALQYAIDEGFEDILVPQVGFAMSNNNIDLWSQLSEHGCDYILIQQKVWAKYTDPDYDYVDIENLNINEYLLSPLVYNTGEIVSFDMVHYCGLCVQEWVQKVIDWYGDEYFDNFLKFISDYDITDTHYGNIGYAPDGRPVIFDWFSY